MDDIEEYESEQIQEPEVDTEIQKNPYKYIRKHYEDIYPYIGSKAMSVISLLPVSLILPKIARKNKMIRSHLSLILLAPAGAGKTSLALEMEKFTKNPVSTEKITPARFAYEINKRSYESDNPQVSLIISDVATIFMDETLIKILENILEEGYISRNTMRNKDEETKQNIEAISFLSGTPENVNDNRLKRGLLFRALNMIIFHTEEEHENIIDFVSESIGIKSETNNNGDEIINFYKELYSIQEGKHHLFSPIEGFIFSDSIKKEVAKFIKPRVKNIFRKHGITFVRTVEDAFRIMCSHAFLNIYNRKIEGNSLIIQEEDLKVAKHLIHNDLATKSIILDCIDTLDYYGVKTRNQLRDWELRMRTQNKVIPKEAKFLMSGMVK